ncbi:MAG: hypothetical protein MJZ67_04385 [Bacteroidales bacterium]|nr:hypothetical protein [Bacteroidales bacterium]
MNQTDNIEHNSEEPKAHKKVSLFNLTLGGGFLQSRWFVKQRYVLLMALVGCLALVYMRYKAESLSKAKMAALERRDNLRQSHIEMQKRYQETIKISKIAELLDSTGVRITAGPPFEI